MVEPFGVPISVIAGFGALVLLIVASFNKKIAIKPVFKKCPLANCDFFARYVFGDVWAKKCRLDRLFVGYFA